MAEARSRTPSFVQLQTWAGSKIVQFYVSWWKFPALHQTNQTSPDQTRIEQHGMKREIRASSDSGAGLLQAAFPRIVALWWFFHKKLELLAPAALESSCHRGQRESGCFRIYRYHASNITEKGEPQNPRGCRVKPFHEYKTTHYCRCFSCLSSFREARYSYRLLFRILLGDKIIIKLMVEIERNDLLG